MSPIVIGLVAFVSLAAYLYAGAFCATRYADSKPRGRGGDLKSADHRVIRNLLVLFWPLMLPLFLGEHMSRTPLRQSRLERRIKRQGIIDEARRASEQNEAQHRADLAALDAQAERDTDERLERLGLPRLPEDLDAPLSHLDVLLFDQRVAGIHRRLDDLGAPRSGSTGTVSS